MQCDEMEWISWTTLQLSWWMKVMKIMKMNENKCDEMELLSGK